MNHHHSFSDTPLFKKCFFYLHPHTFQVIDVRKIKNPVKASPAIPTSQQWEEDEEDLDLQSEDEE